MPTLIRPAGYVRLSREDLRDPTPIDEKFRLRIAITLDLAHKQHIPLQEEDIIVERASGKSLSGRPATRALLERCQKGEVTHLLTPYQDRLLRGSKADEAEIELALIRGRVILITTEHITDFGDPNYDPLPFELYALMARRAIYEFGKKRRLTNTQRSKLGRRSSGSAPYGYTWIPAEYQNRQVTREAHYETVPQEYAVVVEIFDLIRTESLWGIVNLLNARLTATGQPVPPGSRFNPTAISVWRPNAVARILHNPIYAGYPVGSMSRMVGGLKKPTDPQEWVWAEAEQSYPHPVNLDEWRSIQSRLSERQFKRYGNTASAWILTGLLYCTADHPMICGSTREYSCAKRSVVPHPNQTYIMRHRIEAVAGRLWQEAMLTAVQASETGSVKAATDRAEFSVQHYLEAQKELEKLEKYARNLMQESDLHRRYNPEMYEQTVKENAAAIQAQRTLVDSMAHSKAQTIPVQIADLRQHLADQETLRRYWEVLDSASQKELLHLVFSKLKLLPNIKGSYVRELAVTPCPWLIPLWNPGIIKIKDYLA